MCKLTTLAVLVVGVAPYAASVREVSAQAYCALRDPTKQIYELYPEANAFRSIVRTVGESARQAVSEELSFRLHFNELGRHTLYVATRDHFPLGLVHVRSEKSKWGLVEVCWALDHQLCVVDFEFQRCRSGDCKKLTRSGFRKQLRGLSKRALRNFLADNGKSLRGNASLDIPEGTEELAAIVLRSALKTIVVTENVWMKQGGDLCLITGAPVAFSQGTEATVIDNPYSPKANKELESLLGTQKTIIDRDTLFATRVLSASGTMLGYTVSATCHWPEGQMRVWWAISEQIKVLRVEGIGDWPDEDTRKAFMGMVGQGLDHTETCSTATGLATTEVLVICKNADS
ncbi:MAG: hypothetical protein ACPGXK_00915 [Phycisphaerae bacterium]